MIEGRRRSQQVRIFNGMTGSYLMIEKHSSDSYSVFVAQRNGVSNLKFTLQKYKNTKCGEECCFEMVDIKR